MTNCTCRSCHATDVLSAQSVLESARVDHVTRAVRDADVGSRAFLASIIESQQVTVDELVAEIAALKTALRATTPVTTTVPPTANELKAALRATRST